MAVSPPELLRAVEQLSRGETFVTTPRMILSWFDAQGRGARVVARIRQALDSNRVTTVPDFEEVWLDHVIHMKLNRPLQKAPLPSPGEPPPDSTTDSALPKREVAAEQFQSGQAEPAKSDTSVVPNPAIPQDPAARISRLRSATSDVVSIAPGTTLVEALTIMMARDFSQLPVLQNERIVRGAVTFEAIARRQLLGNADDNVDSYLEPVVTVPSGAALLDTIAEIVKHGFVLVLAADKTIQGIVTTADLSEELRSLGEPFLLLGEIESRFRLLIQEKFTVEELQGVKNEADKDRKIEDVYDLTFGEYLRLVEKPDRWVKLGLRIHRATFLKELQAVREIRNDVMHFEPDAVTDERRRTLARVAAFLAELHEYSQR